MPSLFQRLSSLWKKPQAPVLQPSPSPMLAIASQPPQSAEPANPLRPLNEELVYAALRNCYDPEIPLNIVDLGLIYDVHITADRVDVKMTLTAQGCGMGAYIAHDAEEKIRELPGVREAAVRLVWDPPWNPSMISQVGRKTLGLPE